MDGVGDVSVVNVGTTIDVVRYRHADGVFSLVTTAKQPFVMKEVVMQRGGVIGSATISVIPQLTCSAQPAGTATAPPFAVARRSDRLGVTRVPQCVYRLFDVNVLAAKVLRLAMACNLLAFEALCVSSKELLDDPLRVRVHTRPASLSPDAHALAHRHARVCT